MSTPDDVAATELRLERAAEFRSSPCPDCGPHAPKIIGNYPCTCRSRHFMSKCLRCKETRWHPERGEQCGEINHHRGA